MNGKRSINQITGRPDKIIFSASKKYVLFFMLLCLSKLGVMAQPTLQFQNFSQEDGLASDFVLSILQDHQGFMWIGTENGLNRFDGQHFLSFRFDPEDPETLSDNWIWTLLEDHQHQLWIGTQRGLNRLHLETGKIERVPLIKNGQEVKAAIINNIYESPSGSVWVAALNQGVFKLEKDPQGTKWQAVHFASDQPTLNIAHATADELWVVHANGIDKIQISSQETVHYLFPNSGMSVQDEFYKFSGINQSKGKILVGFQNELFALDTSKDQPEFQAIQDFNSISEPSVLITGDFLFDRPDVLFFPSDKDLALFNLESGNLEFIQKEGQVDKHLFRNPVHAVYKDQQGNYWIGTAGGGLFLGQDVKKAFTFYQHDPSNPSSISKGQVRSILEGNNGNIWVGIIDYGLDYLILQEHNHFKRNRSVIANPSQKNSLATDKIIKLLPGDDQTIWVATNDNGLMKLDATGETMEIFDHHPDDPNSLSGNRVWGLAKDQNGYIWAGTWQNGLNRLDPLTGEVKKFRHDPQDPNTLGSNNIRNLFIDKAGALWIGTENGLSRFDPGSEQFTHFQYDQDDPNSLSDNLVWAIYEDRQGALWVGTNTGLNRYDPSTGRFEHFYEKDGLPDNGIYGILEDDEGFLWISTKNGLARQLANPSGNSFRALGLAEGLKTISFLPKAYLNSAQSDQLFFGSAEGMLIVRPALLQQDTSQAQLVIHEMRRFKRKAVPEAVVSDFFTGAHQETVRLGYQDQSVIFTLSDLNWLNHPTYTYEFQLVGFNVQWTPLEKNMQVSFSNLPPGTYTLRARAKNLENVSLEATDLLNLSVFPPWWKSWWAYLMYAFVAGSIILLLVRFYLRRQLGKKEAENLRTLDSFKNKLFTNITHEFRTPLTIISGMNEQIKKKPDRWLEEGSELIRKNTGNLLDLINQILELQKLESGKLKLQMQQGDIIPYLKNIFDQFQTYAHSKEQVMAFNTQLEKLEMDYDPEKILRIVSNLLSNAVKYAPERGKVTFQVSSEMHNGLQAEECLILMVKDNGPGIPKDQLPYLFNRFFQASGSGQKVKTGTGIGLSLTYELVKLLNGHIEVDSQLDEGSTFRCYLPITRKAAPLEAVDPINVREALFGSVGQVKKSTDPADKDLPLALIVEDNPDVTQYLQICLEGSYRLELASDGQMGIDRAQELVPDIIVSDVMMPRKDGFELCETLKEDIRTSHVPIILLTAKSDVESRIVGLKQGADDYLGKPFHEEELLVRMQNLLNIRRKLQERYQNLYTQPLPDQKETHPSKEDAFILKLKEMVEARIDDFDFGINELSQALFLSHSQLGRKVKALTGRSLTIYIRSIRLQKARQLLLTTPLSVKEIGYEVGFSSPEHFSRSYTKEFGESPSNTRETGQMRS